MIDDPQHVSIDRLRLEIAELRRSRRRLISAGDTDRREIESALHDGLQQHLVALAVDLRRLTELLDADPIAARSLVAEMTANVRVAMTEATDLAARIYPPLLATRGLAGAIRSAARRHGVAADVDVPAAAHYPPEITIAVYWSCVETLSFASGGSEATVRVLETDGVLGFDVGMDGHLAEEPLARLRDRVEALDGRVEVDVRFGGGSHVHGWLPVAR